MLPASAALATGDWRQERMAAVRGCELAADLISFVSDCDGYVREAALGRAVELADPALLPAITDRLNVAPSAELAAEVLPACADICMAREALELAAALPPHERERIQRAALGSSFGAIRTAALRALLATPSEEHDAISRAMLFDLQASARSVAARYLDERGMESLSLYTAKLEDGSARTDERRVSLLALAAARASDHLLLVKRYVQSDCARVQAAAFMSWLRLEPAARDEILAGVLQSGLARVRKLTIPMLRGGAYINLPDAIAMAEARGDHDLMLKLAQRDPWQWIAAIAHLHKRSAGDPIMLQRLHASLRHWVNRSGSIYTNPTDEQRRLLSNCQVRSGMSELLGKRAGWRYGKQFDATFKQFGLA